MRAAKLDARAVDWRWSTFGSPGSMLESPLLEELDAAAIDLHVGTEHMGGLHLTVTLRASAALPVVAYSNRELTELEKVMLLDNDIDVMSDPVSNVGELFARLHKSMRHRSGTQRIGSFRLGDLEFDPRRGGEVFFRGEPLSLTKQDRVVLAVLVGSSPGLVAHGDLAAAIGWGTHYRHRSLLEVIARLRRKLEPARVTVVTVAGVGVRLAECTAAAQTRKCR